MFDPASRYYNLESAEFTLPDGDKVTYKRRRMLPAGESLPLLVEVSVQPGERLDLIANRVLGDPLQFWRIADANNAMNPQDLTAEAGSGLRVPVPQPGQ
jgi:nucleoid-associated protein YgaU